MTGHDVADGPSVRPNASRRVVTSAGVRVAGVPGLPVGTRVQLREGARLAGTVKSCPRPEWSFGVLGLFAVRLDNGISQICHASDVIVLAQSDRKPISEQEVLAQTGA